MTKDGDYVEDKNGDDNDDDDDDNDDNDPGVV